MFQFSDDFDAEAEDFLNIPLDGELDQNNQNFINRNEKSLTNAVDSTISNDPVFEDFDDEDDERILSVVENVDSLINQSAHNSTLNDSSLYNHKPGNHSSWKESSPSLLHNLRQENSTSLNEFAISTSKNKSVQERLDSFVRVKPAVSSHSTPKREQNTSFNESPSMCKPLEAEYERKFPGPAGLRLKKSLNYSLSGKFDKSGFKKQLNVSGTENVLTNNISWLELMKEIKTGSCEQSKLMNEYTVLALERKNNFKLISRKIPVFAAVISSVDPSVSDPSVRLNDVTGEIRGTLSRDLWEQYSHLLVVGSALLLRHVSMLSFSNSRMLHLNITTNNIDTIYSHHSGAGSVLITRVTPTALNSLYEKLSDDVTIDLNTSDSVNHSIISTKEKVSAKSFENSSISSRVPSIDSELEGIDVDSLLDDF